MAEDQALRGGASLAGGRYVVESVVGRGGFGITYRAQDTSLERAVAIKEFFLAGSVRSAQGIVPPPQLQEEFAARKGRILDEAKALARFRHPGIVTVHEFFEENDTVYVVMEFLDGRSLKAELGAHPGGLPVERVLRYADEIGAALDAIHAASLLHRDIKPDNVMVLDDDHVVLVDFGTAREFSEGQSSLMSQTLTPGYAPVEQYTARGTFGPATDVYAFGATLYHLLTGVFPTPSLDRYTGRELRAPAEMKPAVGARVSDAVMWAMALEVADRPQSAGRFVAGLHGEEPPEGVTAATRLDPDTGSTAAAWGTRSVAATQADAGQAAVGAATGAFEDYSPEAVSRARRRRKVRRGVRRAGRLVFQVVITIIIGIIATVAVQYFVEGAEPDPSAPSGNSAPPIVREIDTTLPAWIAPGLQ